MIFQHISLPLLENKIGETSWFTEQNILKPLLNKHMAPKGKTGLVIVKEGSLEFVWEDDLTTVLTCDSNHPIVIEPERYHHIIITGAVLFNIEFYKDSPVSKVNNEAIRPGELFIKT